MRSDLKKLDSFTLETSKNHLIRSFLRNGRLRVKDFLMKIHNELFPSAESPYFFSYSFLAASPSFFQAASFSFLFSSASAFCAPATVLLKVKFKFYYSEYVFQILVDALLKIFFKEINFPRFLKQRSVENSSILESSVISEVEKLLLPKEKTEATKGTSNKNLENLEPNLKSS